MTTTSPEPSASPRLVPILSEMAEAADMTDDKIKLRIAVLRKILAETPDQQIRERLEEYIAELEAEPEAAGAPRQD